MKIAIVYDLHVVTVPGTSGDAEDAWPAREASTALAAARHALAVDHEVLLLRHDNDMEDRLLAFWPDIVINLTTAFASVEPESSLAVLLERWHLPYTGSPIDVLHRCYDKGACRRKLRRKGLPIPVFQVVQTLEDTHAMEGFPLLVKPLFEANPTLPETEVVAHTASELRARVRWILETYEQPALVETALPGKKFTVALLGNGLTAVALPLIEWNLAPLPAETVAVVSAEEAQPWLPGTASRYRHHCPVDLAPELAQTMTALAQQAFVALECQDVCTVLLRLDADGKPYILDVDPQPDLLPSTENPSALLTAATAAGMGYPDFIRQLWHVACLRYGLIS